ncbi:MAG: DUF4390 domain-containing protein [Burkholderiales bacterium]
MPSSKSASAPWRLALGALLFAIVASWVAMPAKAEGIAPVFAKVESGADGYHLDAEFDIRFSPGLEEAVNRGVMLYFVVEFELSKPRWYWFDEKPVQLSQTYKISYTPLLRQYRLSAGSAYQNFTRFEDIVSALSRVRGWPVADSGALRKQGEYQAAIRMRLDTTQLPKPFQLNAVASRDWNLASDWYRWTVTP